MLPCQINGFMYLDPVRLNDHHLKSQLEGRMMSSLVIYPFVTLMPHKLLSWWCVQGIVVTPILLLYLVSVSSTKLVCYKLVKKRHMQGPTECINIITMRVWGILGDGIMHLCTILNSSLCSLVVCWQFLLVLPGHLVSCVHFTSIGMLLQLVT